MRKRCELRPIALATLTDSYSPDARTDSMRSRTSVVTLGEPRPSLDLPRSCVGEVPLEFRNDYASPRFGASVKPPYALSRFLLIWDRLLNDPEAVISWVNFTFQLTR